MLYSNVTLFASISEKTLDLTPAWELHLMNLPASLSFKNSQRIMNLIKNARVRGGSLILKFNYNGKPR